MVQAIEIFLVYEWSRFSLVVEPTSNVRLAVSWALIANDRCWPSAD